MAHLSGKLTKKLVENLGAGRQGDGSGLCPGVDPSGARRWIVRVIVKGQRNKKGAPFRTDFGLDGADVVTLNQARERALELPVVRVLVSEAAAGQVKSTSDTVRIIAKPYGIRGGDDALVVC